MQIAIYRSYIEGFFFLNWRLYEGHLRVHWERLNLCSEYTVYIQLFRVYRVYSYYIYRFFNVYFMLYNIQLLYIHNIYYKYILYSEYTVHRPLT